MKIIQWMILCVLLVFTVGCTANQTAPDATENGGDKKVMAGEALVGNSVDEEAAAVNHGTPVGVPPGDVVEIKEKLFIAQTNDIYINAQDYLGKCIKYEGIFDIYEIPETGETFYSVIRFGPGCCGDDGNVGFEVTWDGEYPESNDWVEAVGVLEEYEEEGLYYLRIALTDLTKLAVRGAEVVS